MYEYQRLDKRQLKLQNLGKGLKYPVFVEVVCVKRVPDLIHVTTITTESTSTIRKLLLL